MSKKLIFLLLFLFSALFYFVYNLRMRSVDGFLPSNITLHIQNPKLEIAYTQEERERVHEILNQPFHYLAKGKQSYAFQSQDGRYILKFIKCQRLRASCFYRYLPDYSWIKKYRTKALRFNEKKRNALFSSYFIAASALASETGLIFSQLYTPSFLQKTVTLVDRAGGIHEINLKDTPCVIQHTIKPVFTVLEDLWEAGEREKLQARLREIVQVIMTIAKKGFRDSDSSLIKRNNLGFMADQAAYIDIGTFKPLPKKDAVRFIMKDLKSLKPIEEWLQKRDPALASEFQNELVVQIKSFQHSPLELQNVGG